MSTQPDLIDADTPVGQYTVLETASPVLVTPSEPMTQGSAEPSSIPRTLYKKLSESGHPAALMSYLSLRLAPIAIYLFGLWFTSNYILFFILIILLLAADFWNVKNVAGRLLVGLRWWNETTDVGKAVLVFETSDPSRKINPVDSHMFWLLLYLCPVLWIVLGVIAILRFHFLSLILVLVAVGLTSINSMAYTKCDKFGKANTIASNVLGSVTGSVFDRMNPFRNVF